MRNPTSGRDMKTGVRFRWMYGSFKSEEAANEFVKDLNKLCDKYQKSKLGQVSFEYDFEG
jgi:hypothetical protein